MKFFLPIFILFASFRCLSQKSRFDYFSLVDTTFHENSIYVLHNIKFAFCSATILDESKDSLNTVINFLLNHPELIVELQVHGDIRAKETYSNCLTCSRADSLVAYLTANGIPKNQLIPKGYGGTRPYLTQEIDSINYSFLRPNCILSQSYIEKNILNEEFRKTAYILNLRIELKIVRIDYYLLNKRIKNTLN